MQITSAEFLVSLTEYKNFKGIGRKEIAFAGRSNVGKSSLINALCRRKGLAKTSSTPGKTKLINVFDINGEFFLVDLPGYGFAKVSKNEKERWSRMMDEYFKKSEHLAACILLVDLRHKPTQQDMQMADFLKLCGIPFTVVATKADKLSRAQQNKGKMDICHTLALQPWQVIVWSSETGLGRENLLEAIEKHLD
ncbi:MAG: ribosome biogenesis GTP-binding protein YihA/YsxC [Eubacteriales bacterium]|nr:ribosome biogenesis GTP-binding protein YihA/YsxC [Eubacteriales bacterium]